MNRLAMISPIYENDNVLYYFRATNGLTIREVAAEYGIPAALWSQWETGLGNPTLPSLEKIHAITGESYDNIVASLISLRQRRKECSESQESK